MTEKGKDSAALVAGFSIDRSKPPYEVPCPHCFAFALEPCKSRPREWVENRLKWPADARILPEPHKVRWAHWEKNPAMRVKAVI